MRSKPRSARGYPPGAVERVRRTLLLIASKLGDLMEEIVVVGGIVPYLLVEQSALPGDRRHVGTMDLDLGLSLAVLDGERYREISARLRGEGFRPEEKLDGGVRRQTWAVGEGVDRVTVDFLIPPNRQGALPGKLTQIEADFAAITIEGLDLAFAGRRAISLSGPLPNGSSATRQLWVCGFAAFIVLKAMAFRLRGENKDAYDLFYVLCETSAEDVLADFRALPAGHPTVAKAVRILREDFVVDDVGRAHAAEFITGGRDEALEADVLAFVAGLLARVDRA